MGTSFVFIAGSIYARHKSKRTAGIAAAAVNYFLLLPLFEGFMPLNELITAFDAYSLSSIRSWMSRCSTPCP